MARSHYDQKYFFHHVPSHGSCERKIDQPWLTLLTLYSPLTGYNLLSLA